MSDPRTPEARRYAAHAFLSAVFSGKPDPVVVMAMSDGDWGHAAAYQSWRPVVERYRDPDVYVGCCGLGRKPGRGSRGKAGEAAFWPGCWADIDVNGGPVRGSDQVVTGHAPSTEAAMRLLESFARPTLIVTSGYGLQAWWLLKAGWALRDAGMQRRAGLCVEALQAALRDRAGWKIDQTGDLARVLRMPGSTNTKGETPAPVGLGYADGPRYSLEQLEQLGGGRRSASTEPVVAVSPEEWVQRIQTGDATDSTRHERIWQLSGYLLRRGIDPAVAVELVLAFNDARLSAPYPADVVRKHFEGIARREEQRRTAVAGTIVDWRDAWREKR